MTNNEFKFYIKLKQKKFREYDKLFLIEGIHLVNECIKSDRFKIKKIIVRKDFDLNKIDKVDKYKNVIDNITDNLFDKISDTENSQGIIAVTGMIENTGDIYVKKEQIILALEKINDPGNLGTILRTCWWFGIHSVIISENSADVYNPKVIRASQGAIFNLNIYKSNNLFNELSLLEKLKYNIVLTELDAECELHEMKFKKARNYIIVFGNEANGISPKLKEINSFSRIKINSFSNCESLNVASAAAIVLYEIKKII